jgi:hypothetical protein
MINARMAGDMLTVNNSSEVSTFIETSKMRVDTFQTIYKGHIIADVDIKPSVRTGVTIPVAFNIKNVSKVIINDVAVKALISSCSTCNLKKQPLIIPRVYPVNWPISVTETDIIERVIGISEGRDIIPGRPVMESDVVISGSGSLTLRKGFFIVKSSDPGRSWFAAVRDWFSKHVLGRLALSTKWYLAHVTNPDTDKRTFFLLIYASASVDK